MNRILASLLLAGVSGFAGCAGTPQPATADSGEYEYVTPTGSNIPVRVRKGQSATVSTSPTGTMSGDQAASMINSAGGKVPISSGAR